MRYIRRWSMVAGIVVVIMIAGVLSGAFVRPAQAFGLGDILKVGGIVLAVSTFGGQINSFINHTLSSNDARVAGATKVVPILSIGRGAYVGAAQVVGIPENVRRVQGVAALELSAGNLSGNALIPISTRSANRGNLSRVGGVGVSAIIDFHI